MELIYLFVSIHVTIRALIIIIRAVLNGQKVNEFFVKQIADGESAFCWLSINGRHKYLSNNAANTFVWPLRHFATSSPSMAMCDVRWNRQNVRKIIFRLERSVLIA